MKLNNLKAIVFLTFIFSSCELIVDIDVPVEEPRMAMKIVLNRAYTQEEVFQISRSKFILEPRTFNNETDYVENVSLKIYDETGNVWDSLVPFQLSGWPYASYKFANNIKPEQGKTYRMEANAPGLPSAIASFTTPLEITDLNVIAKKVFRAGRDTTFQTPAQLNIRFKDPSSQQKNYFLIEANLIDENNNYLLFGVYQDYNDGAIGSIGVELNNVFSDDYAVNGEVNILINVIIEKMQFQAVEGKIAIRVFSLTEDEFQHEKTLRAFYESDGNPFAEPVNVYSNIEGGFGIFSGRSEVNGIFNVE